MDLESILIIGFLANREAGAQSGLRILCNSSLPQVASALLPR
jgi:hypothetical protein